MANATKYQTFNLLSKEIAFDIDVSTLDCVYSSCLYFVAMDADGGSAKRPVDTAGSKYGTGYCDASCPRAVKWINGEVMRTLLGTKIQAIANSLPRQTSRNGLLHQSTNWIPNRLGMGFGDHAAPK
jgi:hypothetical protein